MPAFSYRNLFIYILLPALGLLLHAASYYPFLSDDAFISMRYSQRLLDGFGLTWTSGIPVEGYSNLSWVLVTAFLGCLGLDMPVAVRLVGYCSFVAILVLNYCLWYQPNGLLKDDKQKQRQNTALLWSQWFLVICAPIAVWSIAGLEQPFVALFLLMAVAFTYLFYQKTTRYYLLLSSFSLALLCLTRPDSPLACVALAIGIWWSKGLNKQTFKDVCVLALLPILAVSGQMAFRLSFYNDFVPNTAHIKTGFSALHILQGCLYIVQTFACLFPWSFFFIRESISAARKGHMLIKLTLPIMFLWIIYAIYIGGDIFPGLRHMVPMIALMALVSPLLFMQMISRGWFANKIRVCVYSFIFISIQIFNPVSMPAHFQSWEWDGKVLAYTLKEGFKDKKPLLAVTAAGALPFYSQFEAIDMLGLNDHHIARNPASDPSQHYIAHGHADGEYVFYRRPDLVSFCIPWESQYEPCFISGHQLHAIPAFKQEYVAARFKGYRPYEYTGIVWVYKFSEKIGLQVEGETIIVPSYLLSDYRHTVSTLYENSDKGFYIEVVKGKPAKVSGIKATSAVLLMSEPENKDLVFKVQPLTEDSIAIEVTTDSIVPIKIDKLIIRAQP